MNTRWYLAGVLGAIVLSLAPCAYAKDSSVRIQASLTEAADGGYAQVVEAMREFRASEQKYLSQECTLKAPPMLSLSADQVSITATFVCK